LLRRLKANPIATLNLIPQKLILDKPINPTYLSYDSYLSYKYI